MSVVVIVNLKNGESIYRLVSDDEIVRCSTNGFKIGKRGVHASSTAFEVAVGDNYVVMVDGVQTRKTVIKHPPVTEAF